MTKMPADLMQDIVQCHCGNILDTSVFGGDVAATLAQCRCWQRGTTSARYGCLKHGPGGSGLAGPCDPDCQKCAVEKGAKIEALNANIRAGRVFLGGRSLQWTLEYIGERPRDPLEVEYDGLTLRMLLAMDEEDRREDHLAQVIPLAWTSAQRAAVSAHWSAELRAKVAASKERDRLSVLVDLEEP